MSLLHVFGPFLAGKPGKSLYKYLSSFIDSFIVFYRVILWVLWEITTYSKLGLSEGFGLNFVGFWEVGKGFLHWFKGINQRVCFK